VLRKGCILVVSAFVDEFYGNLDDLKTIGT